MITTEVVLLVVFNSAWFSSYKRKTKWTNSLARTIYTTVTLPARVAPVNVVRVGRPAGLVINLERNTKVFMLIAGPDHYGPALLSLRKLFTVASKLPYSTVHNTICYGTISPLGYW